MMALVTFAVLALFFIFVCYMASRTWRVWHVLLLFGLFLFTLVFCFLSAAALRTHREWKKKYQDLAKNLQTQEDRLAQLEHGDLLRPDEEEDNLAALNSRYAQLVVDRGRVWRNVIPVAGQDGISLDLSQWGDDACYQASAEEDEPLEPLEDGEAAAPAAAGPTHGLTEGMLVFGFLEGAVAQLGDAQPILFGDSELPEADTKGHCRVPVAYLGSYRVTAVNGNSVSIVPVLPLDEQQVQDVQTQGTWALYELLPVDNHMAFSGLTEEQLAVLLPAEEASEYARDLQSALASDEDARTRRRVKFLRDFEVDVDVEGDEAGIERDFDPSGRAILANLRQGGPTKFSAGETPKIYFPTTIARQWQRDGICEFVDEEPIFVRPLRDYAYYFAQKDLQIAELTAAMEVLKQENESIAVAEAKAREQQAYREQELVHLGEDRGKINEEIAILTRFRDQLVQQRESQLAELGGLYQWNNQLADEWRDGVFVGTQALSR